jgi:hypothetical protein
MHAIRVDLSDDVIAGANDVIYVPAADFSGQRFQEFLSVTV